MFERWTKEAHREEITEILLPLYGKIVSPALSHVLDEAMEKKLAIAPASGVALVSSRLKVVR